MPVACIKEYIIVGPTKVKPRFFMSELIFRERSVEDGTWESKLQLL
jgi:hypothetical protein